MVYHSSASNRELHHINPKGRPVKQCEHCRGARKSKSHHAKCDCGDKKDKDKHKDKGDAKGEIMPGALSRVNSNDSPAHANGCQCHSGGKCICGTIKEESLDLKIDTSRQTLHEARAKPKLTTAQSESHLTVFANGHHKPCHRSNNTAHVSGMPYKIPRPHTLHGQSSFAALARNDNNYNVKPEAPAPASRSMDTLSLSNPDFYAFLGNGQRPNGLPMTTMAGSLDTLNFQDSFFNNQNGTFGVPESSNSPESNVSDNFSTQQWPWTTTTGTPVNYNFDFGSLSTSPSQECLPNLDSQWSIPSAGFDPIWSAGDLPLDPSKLNDSLTQPISHSGESKQSGPGLTVASSVHSEIGEPNPFADMDFNKAPQSAASESLFWEDQPVYRFSTAMPTESLAAPMSIPVTTMSTSQAFESDFSKSQSIAPATMPTTSMTDFADAAAIAIPGSFDDVVPNDPWPMEQNLMAFDSMNAFDTTYAQNWLYFSPFDDAMIDDGTGAQ
ncbi:hypothetical protein E8E12_007881 [Didymella heteroderae]|uniref:Copper-fist domain-containing protein n=1 Tax=Didymella heteroderae TaxID=1769908 RepID=A0A9P5C018_9PLEO|nr:hypothetical protein E8E12_007881 [Didymella heteroderae]